MKTKDNKLLILIIFCSFLILASCIGEQADDHKSKQNDASEYASVSFKLAWIDNPKDIKMKRSKEVEQRYLPAESLETVTVIVYDSTGRLLARGDFDYDAHKGTIKVPLGGKSEETVTIVVDAKTVEGAIIYKGDKKDVILQRGRTTKLENPIDLILDLTPPQDPNITIPFERPDFVNLPDPNMPIPEFIDGHPVTYYPLIDLNVNAYDTYCITSYYFSDSNIPTSDLENKWIKNPNFQDQDKDPRHYRDKIEDYQLSGEDGLKKIYIWLQDGIGNIQKKTITIVLMTIAPPAPDHILARGGEETITIKWRHVETATRYYIYWDITEELYDNTDNKIVVDINSPDLYPATDPNYDYCYYHKPCLSMNSNSCMNQVYCYVMKALNPYEESPESRIVKASIPGNVGIWDNVAWDDDLNEFVWGD